MRSIWRHPLCLAPHPLRPWLSEEGSLTRKLQSHFAELQVKRIRQLDARPHRDEWQCIGLHHRKQCAAVRDVLLTTQAGMLVFAHSITTRAALRGGMRLFRQAGNRPLGMLLFASPKISRGPLSWCRINSRHPLWIKANQLAGPLPKCLWARRSIFSSGKDRLLVTELFLPTLEFNA